MTMALPLSQMVNSKLFVDFSYVFQHLISYMNGLHQNILHCERKGKKKLNLLEHLKISTSEKIFSKCAKRDSDVQYAFDITETIGLTFKP